MMVLMGFSTSIHKRSRKFQLLVCVLFATLHVVLFAALMPHLRPLIVTDEEMASWGVALRELVNVWSLDIQHAPMLIGVTAGVTLGLYVFLRISKKMEEVGL